MASSPQEVLSILRREVVDVCIIDQYLPSVDGVDLCKMIREEWADIVIILTTTDTRPHKLAEPLAVGVNKVMFKPFDWDSLSPSIGELTKKATITRSTYPQHAP